jgi:hypothetical protein
MRGAAALAAAIALAALVVVPGSGAVTRGVVVFGQSAAGIQLGMSRAQVTAKLGKPVAGSARFMQYGAKPLVFDLYLDSGRVDLMHVGARGFCTAQGFCVGDRMSEVFRLDGKRLKPVRAQGSIEPGYVLVGSLKGHTTYTKFLVAGGKLGPGAVNAGLELSCLHTGCLR